jgi:acetolactate synthase-1/2/3 large subunit
MVKISSLIAEFLAGRGIEHIFGIVGAGNVHIFDSIGRLGKTEIVCVHHEQAACMAMQTYFRTSGVVTASLVTTGGGSTNALTGVVSSWMDSIPGVVLAGNENSKYTTAENQLRIWGVQGYDSVEAVRKVTKYATRVTDPLAVLYELEKAFFIASTGRPGPVWVEIPMNIQAAMVDPEHMSHFVPEPSAETPVRGDELSARVDAVIDLLRASSRPVLWFGHGIRLAGATDELEPLLDVTGAPALVSWAGIDMVRSSHPLVYGRAGVYGQRAANFVLQNSDCVIAIGTRLAIPQIGYEISEFARDATLAVVDIDPLEVSKLGARVTEPVCADAGDFLRLFLERLRTKELPDWSAWRAQCDSYRTRYPWVGTEHAHNPPYINSYAFMDRLQRHFKSDQVVVTDMGTALLSGHQVLEFEPGQRLMTSTGLGEMGYGLPAAIGASFARGRGEVMCLNCDGGMMMNLQELQTVVHHQLPIKLFIFNNDGYLMIKHTQNALFAGNKVGVDRKSGVTCPDFSAVAKAFGIPSFQIRTWEDVDDVLPRVQAESGTVICEVFMDPMQLFVPKLSLAARPDGSVVSPPLEDLSPLLPRRELNDAMIVGMHQKSIELGEPEHVPA